MSQVNEFPCYYQPGSNGYKGGTVIDMVVKDIHARGVSESSVVMFRHKPYANDIRQHKIEVREEYAEKERQAEEIRKERIAWRDAKRTKE